MDKSTSKRLKKKKKGDRVSNKNLITKKKRIGYFTVRLKAWENAGGVIYIKGKEGRGIYEMKWDEQAHFWDSENAIREYKSLRSVKDVKRLARRCLE